MNKAAIFDALDLKAEGWKFDWSIPHRNGYRQTLNAKSIDWHTMYIDSYGAIALINKYFKEGE